MSRKIFRKLVELDQAINIIRQYAKPVGVEVVRLENAMGRILAENIIAPLSIPPYDRASVDGYAVRSIDLIEADEFSPVKLNVKGFIPVGTIPSIIVSKNEAVEVSTGSLIPPGADSVVMEEFTERRGNSVFVYRNVAPGDNILETGVDFMQGELVLKRGTKLGFKEVATLAALGLRELKVFRRPKVGVLSTGDELLEPGSPLKEGKVYDVNGFVTLSLLREWGCDAFYLGITPDNPDVLKDVISKAIRQYDMLILSGGTSAGREDLVYRVIDDIGDILIHGIRVKPGKPTLIALVEDKLIIGLPGHPVSAMMMTFILVHEAVLRLTGQSARALSKVKAMILRPLRLEKGKLNLIPVALMRREGMLIAYPTFRASGLLSSILPADGFIMVYGDMDSLKEKTKVEVMLFRSDYDYSVNFIGSHCPAASILLSMLSKEGFTIREIHVGSTEGILSAIRGEADIAGAHLFDELSKEFNVPFIKMLKAEKEVVIVKGYRRCQGLIVAKNNPKGIYELRDLLRSDVRMVNRNRGSGTRILLDIMLNKLAAELNISFNQLIRRIKGYYWELRTHTAVAAAIAQGKADVGIGIEYVARMYNLDFIPIAMEEYDFIIPRRRLSHPPIKAFIKLLSSESAKKEISKLPGMEPSKDMGQIIDLSRS